jgi:hypothetical protein
MRLRLTTGFRAHARARPCASASSARASCSREGAPGVGHFLTPEKKAEFEAAAPKLRLVFYRCARSRRATRSGGDG